MIIEQHPALHSSSRMGFRPTAVVIHIMEGTLVGTTAWFKEPKSNVSTHYSVGKMGEIRQHVHVLDAAWGNGRTVNPTAELVRGEFRGVNPNRWTLSIEHEGFADQPWSPEMWVASVHLTRLLCDVFAIPVTRRHILGHRELRADKACPGWVFDRLDDYVQAVKEVS